MIKTFTSFNGYGMPCSGTHFETEDDANNHRKHYSSHCAVAACRKCGKGFRLYPIKKDRSDCLGGKHYTDEKQALDHVQIFHSGRYPCVACKCGKGFVIDRSMDGQVQKQPILIIEPQKPCIALIKDLDRHQRSCYEKKRYPSEVFADQVIRGRSVDGLRSYHCKVCGGWHITKTKLWCPA